MKVTLSITGHKAALQKLGLIKHGVWQLGSPMRDIGKLLTGFYGGEVFSSRGRVIGEPWAPLSPRYAAWKADNYAGKPPLVRGGKNSQHMIDSFRFQSGATFARIYNTATYFRYHQQGTSRLPKRTMMALDAARRQAIVGIIDKHIKSLLSK